MTEQTPNNPPRIFKIGTTTIQSDESLVNLDNEQVRAILKRTYPEVAHATTRETTLEDGTVVVHYQAVAGRKG
ncbi:MAG: hypothetical protein D6711_04350 [Chloroflexi bacterium]|nr:MAG: hypothetical protein D6711_04350 [Chloroflexota bacterium]